MVSFELFCRESVGLSDVTYQILKPSIFWFQAKRFLNIAFVKPIFWPQHLLMQLTETIYIILLECDPRFITVYFIELDETVQETKVV